MDPPLFSKEFSSSIEAKTIRDGVILLHDVVCAEKQEEICAIMLSGSVHDWSKFQGDEYKANPFMAFCHLAKMRWKPSTAVGAIPFIVTTISESITNSLYGPHGILSSLPENGCAEDHEGRPCACADKTPLFPRSTRLDCVEPLVYRAGSQRGYHRDAHWIVGLTFGCDVIMGFQRHDNTEKFTLTIPSGDAVIFNGALHSHAVLGIKEGTAPSWWKYPFARIVFLMRDARQSLQARRRRDQRREAARKGAKEAAAIAAQRLDVAASSATIVPVSNV